MNILQKLKQEIIITDGAFGTYFREIYEDANEVTEIENVDHPQWVQNVHRQYLEAGARFIRTNTFACNSNFMEGMDVILDCARAGVDNALAARDEFVSANPSVSEDEIYVVGDIGTIFEPVDAREDFLSEYKRICDVFIEKGLPAILFETQSDDFYLKELASYIKEKSADTAVFATFSVDRSGYTRSGLSVYRMIDNLVDVESIDGIGLNCGIEGAHMYELLSKAYFAQDKILLALPNAGYPYMLRGKVMYGKNEKYFLEMEAKLYEAGANILGGCCGTTPEYIRDVTTSLSGKAPVAKKIKRIKHKINGRTQSVFWQKLEAGEKPVVVELDPPFDGDISKVMNSGHLLAEAGVDLITLSDSPMARTRMDSSLLAGKLMRECGIDVMPHIACRDRNLISLRGLLLGNYVNDIRHFLFITGDPVLSSDRATVKGVFDVNSIKLMRMANQMNTDDFSEDTIVFGGGLNYAGTNIDAVIKRIQLKMEQGASFFLTQPVYSPADIERLRQLKEATGAKILAGIMPLVSYKNALFMANEMPGINIPESVLSLYSENATREESEAVAVKVCSEVIEGLSDFADGYYFMVPFNRVGLINRIIKENHLV